MPSAPGVEYIDVTDSAGNPLAVIAPRSEVHTKGLWHRTVHIWVLNGRGELLLQKRSLTKESFPGLWDISAAGHIAAGDTSRSAAVRELNEELGISAKEDDFIYLFSITGHYEDLSRPFIDNEISDVYLLKADIPIEAVSVDKNEVDEAKYMGVADLRRELASHPELYVPHHESYGRLFGVLATLKHSL